jgi:hexosaminidase
MNRGTMTLSILPSPRSARQLSADEGIGADLSAGGRVIAPRGWWTRLRVVLRAIEDGTGATYFLVDSAGDHAGEPLMRFEMDDSLGNEGYSLTVGDGIVSVLAATSIGAAYALQSLRQLLPPEAFRAAVAADVSFTVPAVSILDSPALAWRGVMIDVSRHFLGKTWLLRVVDLMALHKLNVLHLHLTDDQGWRLEIDAFPRLTEVGAYRRETLVGYRFSENFDGRPHGGFLSKTDAREIVQYADDRGITVVPEIDMPGHLLAAVASYPEWGVTGVQTEVLTRWGRSHNVLNLEESTVQAMLAVLDEVMEIFPSEYIHIGGDESPRTEWLESARVQELIRERGLADEDALQRWFTARLADHLRSRGRRLLGWDEILGGDLPSDVTVMAWRDETFAREAMELGHDVVIATQQHLYFDFTQSNDGREPLGPRVFSFYMTDLREVYNYAWLKDFDPKLVARHLKGAQVQLWTEFVPTTEHAEYLLFPRTCAFAERAWSGAPDSFETFLERLEPHLRRLDALGVGYRPLAGPAQGQAGAWFGIHADAPPRLMLSSNDSVQTEK